MVLGLSAQLLAHRRRQRRFQNLASAAYLAGGLAFRFAWVEAGKASATDDEAAAAMGRSGPPEQRLASEARAPLPPGTAGRVWGEAVRRTSLALDRLAQG